MAKLLVNAVRVILPIAVLASCGVVATYLVFSKSTAKPNPPQERVWPVATAEAQRVGVRPTIISYGEIVAGRRLAVAAQVEGRLVQLSPALVNGGVVRAGTLLATVDPFNYEQAVAEREAELAEAEAVVEETRAELRNERNLIANEARQVELRNEDLERNETMVARGTTSTKARDDAAIALTQARANLLGREQSSDRLAARLRQQEAARNRAAVRLAQARRDLAETAIIAPFDGFVDAVNVAVGQRVGPGEAFAEMTQADTLEVKFQLANHHYANLVAGAREDDEPIIGRKVAVRWRVGTQATDFGAKIERVGAGIDAESGGIDLYARLDDAGPASLLRPGAFVEVAVPDRFYRDVFRLPYQSVIDGSTVYIVEEGQLVSRAVEVIRELADDVLVRGDLRSGDDVVVTTFPEIGPGTKVIVSPP